ncbi:MAG: hypothetical protein ACXWKP_19735 [Bradyrhizobium sp.]
MSDDHAAIREGVRSIVARFGDDYWLARDDDCAYRKSVPAVLMMQSKSLESSDLIIDAPRHGLIHVVPQNLQNLAKSLGR